MDRRLHAFIESLESPDTAEGPEALRDRFAAFAASLGFNVFTYAGLRFPDREMTDRPVLSNFPGSWREEYDGLYYERIDPVLTESARRLTPLLWDDLLTREDLSAPQQAIFHEARHHGLAHGMTIPIHGQHGEYAIVSMASELPEREFKSALAENKYALHMASIYYHDHIRDRFARSVEGVANVHLSRREKECLLWAARGKTAWETSEILTLSEHTVKQYLKSAMRKLGVYNKQHAVVRAIMLYLIFP